MRKKFNSFVRTICRVIPDKVYLSLKYRVRMGKWINWKNPKTFNEKLQWLKVYDRKPEYVKMVDKYAVKEYVASKIGGQYIIPTYGVWENFDDIDFETLPNQFVLKCTHDSGGLVICKNKVMMDKEAARHKIEKSLKENYFWTGREWSYKKVKPRIIAEKYMTADSGEMPEYQMKEDLLDYKLMCFNGKVKNTFICSGRNSGKKMNVTFYNREWERMPFERHYPASLTDFPKPDTYDKMIHLAEILSAGIPFIRVDFYEISRQIYFGELTFFPGSGLEEFTPEEWDYNLGELIDLGF